MLEIDKAFLHISPTGSLQILPPTALTPGHAGLPKVEKGVTVLFNSSFENKTDSRQTYSFRTERQTRWVKRYTLISGVDRYSYCQKSKKLSQWGKSQPAQKNRNIKFAQTSKIKIKTRSILSGLFNAFLVAMARKRWQTIGKWSTFWLDKPGICTH